MKIVNLETAKALQGLRYDGEYAKSYTDFGNPTIDITTSLLYPTEIPAPRLDDAAYWLRAKHGLYIKLNFIPTSRLWLAVVTDMYGYYNSPAFYADAYTDYETALEAAVTKAIETIKNNL